MLAKLLSGGDSSGSTAINKFFEKLLRSIGINTGFDIVFYITVALLLINIIVALISVSFSYEKKMYRAIRKLNYFFSKNQSITEHSLIVFNNKMKMVPKNLRYCWQEYMLYRDKAPSDYMDVVTCVDQPLKTSSFSNAIKTANIFGIVIAVLSFIAFLCIQVSSLSNVISGMEGVVNLTNLWQISVVPLLALVVNYLVVVILKLNKTIVTKELYYSYHDFLRNVNKACLTMPSFVDYEVLFTQKEIKSGIPVLQEYLEKRALEEQRAAEDARLNAQEYEVFDFNELGIENAILLDRAMKESEKYFNVKRDLTEKLNSKEAEITNFSKNFDEVTKDFERKSQAIKESLNQINEQLNNTAVKIEANYLKKRYNEDQVKLQQLEKDYDLASSRFNKQQAELEEECEVLRNEIKERKEDVEEAIKVEGKAYANKVYGIINKTVKAQNEPYFAKLEAEKQQMAAQINDMNQTIMNQNAEIQARHNQIIQIEQDLNYKKAEIAAIASVKEYFTSLEFKQMVKGNKKGAKPGNAVDASEYNQVVQQLQNQITDKQNEIDRLNASLQQCQEELATKQNELNAKEEQIVAKNKEIEMKNNELQEKNKQIEKHQQEIKTVNEELKAKKEEKPEKVIVEVEKKSSQDDEAVKKLKEASKKQNELLSKLKSLEDVEKKNKEEKTKIKNRNLSKLMQIQKGIETENDKYADNKKKLKKNVDDAISAIEDNSKKDDKIEK